MSIRPVDNQVKVASPLKTAALCGAMAAGVDLLSVKPENRQYVVAAMKNSFLSEDTYVTKAVEMAKKSVENLGKQSAKKAVDAPFVSELKKYDVDLKAVAEKARDMYPGMKQTGEKYLKQMGKSFAKFALFSLALSAVGTVIAKAIAKNSMEK